MEIVLICEGVSFHRQTPGDVNLWRGYWTKLHIEERKKYQSKKRIRKKTQITWNEKNNKSWQYLDNIISHNSIYV